MSTSIELPRPADGYAAGCARLALKHGLGFMIWREVGVDSDRYRVNVRMGSNDGPFPHWAEIFPIDRPLAEAVDRVAGMAWGYFTSTGYKPPAEGDGLSQRDLAWTPARKRVDFAAERAERERRGL